MTNSKPTVVIGVLPGPGHFNPTYAVAKGLIARGYGVTIVTARHFREKVEDIGAKFVQMTGRADLTSEIGQKLMAERLTKGKDMMKFMMKEYFVNAIPDQFRALQAAMKAVDASKPVVILSESMFFGSLPSMLSAGIQPAAHLSIGVSPLFLSSIDTAPFGPGLPPDSSPEGQKKNIEMTKEIQASFQETQTALNEVLENMGIQMKDLYWMDAPILLPDRYIQMCLPSLEYFRSDAPSSIRFCGGLAPSHHVAGTHHPPWWNEIMQNSSRCWITSGLIVPSLTALKDRKDIIAVAILAKKDAILSEDDFPPGAMIPSNAHVIDFLPYNDILAHSDLFITNGGYGGFQHAVGNGVPLIVAGTIQDKPEIAMRVEWAGVGVNMRTNVPTVQALRDAVNEILENKKYLMKVKELATEMAKWEPIQIIADNIDELAALKAEAS